MKGRLWIRKTVRKLNCFITCGTILSYQHWLPMEKRIEYIIVCLFFFFSSIYDKALNYFKSFIKLYSPHCPFGSDDSLPLQVKCSKTEFHNLPFTFSVYLFHIQSPHKNKILSNTLTQSSPKKQDIVKPSTPSKDHWSGTDLFCLDLLISPKYPILKKKKWKYPTIWNEGPITCVLSSPCPS